LITHLRATAGGTTAQLTPAQNTFAAHTLAIVANAINGAQWARLKTCDDCQWAFYDHTRSANKRWCGMSKGGPQGRACGTIAKVRAFRERQVGNGG
jgi:predicted RNA-binding Zn ribbon-like protein